MNTCNKIWSIWSAEEFGRWLYVPRETPSWNKTSVNLLITTNLQYYIFQYLKRMRIERVRELLEISNHLLHFADKINSEKTILLWEAIDFRSSASPVCFKTLISVPYILIFSTVSSRKSECTQRTILRFTYYPPSPAAPLTQIAAEYFWNVAFLGQGEFRLRKHVKILYSLFLTDIFGIHFVRIHFLKRCGVTECLWAIQNQPAAGAEKLGYFGTFPVTTPSFVNCRKEGFYWTIWVDGTTQWSSRGFGQGTAIPVPCRVPLFDLAPRLRNKTSHFIKF